MKSTTLFYQDARGEYKPFNISKFKTGKLHFCIVRVGDLKSSLPPKQSEIDHVNKILSNSGLHDYIVYHQSLDAKLLTKPNKRFELLIVLGDKKIGWIPEDQEISAIKTMFKQLVKYSPNTTVKVVLFNWQQKKQG
jgi:hypothetical protein